MLAAALLMPACSAVRETARGVARQPDEIAFKFGRSSLLGGLESTGWGVEAKWKLGNDQPATDR